MSDTFVVCLKCGNEVTRSFSIYWCNTCNRWLSISQTGIYFTEYFKEDKNENQSDT